MGSALDRKKRERIKDLLLRTRFANSPAHFLASDAGKFAIEAQTNRRYEIALHNIVPWVDRSAGLRGRNVVEIGSGTGSSAAAFATLAAQVDGYEIHSGSVEIAAQRFEILGLSNARVHVEPPGRMEEVILSRHAGNVDLFLLYAVLEHMTVQERLSTLRTVWSLLPPGGIVVVVETPNRLSYLDRHTSQLPFFHMLPLELAAMYYTRSPRQEFVQQVGDANDSAMTITRWGTGVSYHDFEIGFGCDMNGLVIADGYEDEITAVYPIREEDRVLRGYFETTGLDVPVAFARYWLNIVFRKPAAGRESGPSAGARDE